MVSINQVVSITAYNNGPNDDAIFCAYYDTSKVPQTIVNRDNLRYSSMNSNKVGWNKFREEMCNVKVDPGNIISVTHCCNCNGGGVSYLWYRNRNKI